MREEAISCRFLTVVSLELFCLLLIVITSGCKEKPQEQVVELKEISAFEVPDELHWDFCRGQPAQCSEQPDPNVTSYPNFASNKPLFGSVHLPREFYRGFRGRWYRFAIDQTDTAGQSYDTLYFDLNCDLDLTNDKPLVVQQNPPKGAGISQTRLKQQICFDYLRLELPFGDKGTRPLEIMPQFVIDEDGNRYLSLVTTKAFKGTVDIAGRSYEVWLGHNRGISGWFDHPSTALHLIPEGDFGLRNPLFNRLMEWRRIGKTDYCFSASPSGDKLIVKPYQGKYGTIKVAPVNSRTKRAGMSGVLFSGDAVFWVGGRFDKNGHRKPVPSCRVPVGDYAASLEIYLDDLNISTTANSHSDGSWHSGLKEGPFLGIRIRYDKPFILDFSNKPEVLFASPPKELRLRPGEQLQVEPILIYPKLGMMIIDFGKEKAKLGFVSPDSNLTFLFFGAIATAVGITVILWLLSVIIRSKRRILLVSAGLVAVITVGSAVAYCVVNIEHDYNYISPSVTISRSNGEIVAGGVAPFG